MQPFLVKLDVRDRGDCLSAICSAVPGLHVYGKSLEAVCQSALQAIPRLMASNRRMGVSAFATNDPTEIRVEPRNRLTF